MADTYEPEYQAVNRRVRFEFERDSNRLIAEGFPKIDPRIHVVNGVRHKIDDLLTSSELTCAEVLFILTQIAGSYAAESVREERKR